MRNIILKEVGKVVIPFIQVFALYVIFHGHLSPGGGFAGGTIFGASLIVYRIVYGKNKAQQKISYGKLMKYMCISLIFYGVLKGYSFITGGSHIEVFQVPLGTPGHILSAGYLLPLNIAVGIVVSMTMYLFFALFYEGEV
ncbi:MnhB domain-containing protein [Petroclostridium sp. X23]|jgi:multicomponent Na+:H+ antiporter subunit B|uniref:MnhB domain-containing protein n=1 Tax=Petroclostridium sp. X23 TaxID=3045146 RepID=UPI0024AD47D6|nr:MnhB domain-containing protein [Petroclostridium sp. X23]WHH58775.1 MnhB domain-containing protein [Petroclostridium sp. X23]